MNCSHKKFSLSHTHARIVLQLKVSSNKNSSVLHSRVDVNQSLWLWEPPSNLCLVWWLLRFLIQFLVGKVHVILSKPIRRIIFHYQEYNYLPELWTWNVFNTFLYLYCTSTCLGFMQLYVNGFKKLL